MTETFGKRHAWVNNKPLKVEDVMTVPRPAPPPTKASTQFGMEEPAETSAPSRRGKGKERERDGERERPSKREKDK